MDGVDEQKKSGSGGGGDNRKPGRVAAFITSDGLNFREAAHKIIGAAKGEQNSAFKLAQDCSVQISGKVPLYQPPGQQSLLLYWGWSDWLGRSLEGGGRLKTFPVYHKEIKWVR